MNENLVRRREEVSLESILLMESRLVFVSRKGKGKRKKERKTLINEVNNVVSD